MDKTAHTHPVRVYYEDTDLAGIVYYANYLKFIERGRTEALRAAGVDQMALRASDGVVFAVRRVEADFLAPARMDDLLDITTTVTKATGARRRSSTRTDCRSASPSIPSTSPEPASGSVLPAPPAIRDS